jgi:two-component system, sensor histidine kinase and response regulator
MSGGPTDDKSPPERLARILVVDDETAHMEALCDTLRNHGYETVGFTRARAALERLRGERFDLLLTDMMMPEMGGIDLLRAAVEIDAALVGVIMTGQGTIDTAVEAMQTGALDYILKPFKLSVILPVLSRALTMRRLRLKNDELEQQVREHAAELEVINKDLEAFSYSVSHDLRAPLRGVSAFSTIMRTQFGDRIPVEARDLLDHVIGSARRMEQLIEDLLLFSRMGRQSMIKCPVDVTRLAQEIVNELKQRQPERLIDVRVGALPAGAADPSLLKQVLVNLLSNAFKFTQHKAAAMIEVGGVQRDQEGEYFVRDNGAGFDTQYADRLFGVFQRLHRDDEFEGTGVGLSIVQRIVQRHGGRVWAEAAVGQGATFHFTLPK